VHARSPYRFKKSYGGTPEPRTHVHVRTRPGFIENQKPYMYFIYLLKKRRGGGGSRARAAGSTADQLVGQSCSSALDYIGIS
jgi:hypothetical protein